METEKRPLRKLRETKQEEPKNDGIDFSKRLRSAKTENTKQETKSEPKYTWEILEEASFRKLSRICTDEQLSINSAEFNVEEIDELRAAIAEELGIDVSGSTSEPEPEPEKPTKSIRKQSTTKTTTTEDSPRRRKASEPTVVTSGGKERCPHGHKFGVDLDMFPECAKCTIVDDCEEYYNKNRKK